LGLLVLFPSRAPVEGPRLCLCVQTMTLRGSTGKETASKDPFGCFDHDGSEDGGAPVEARTCTSPDDRDAQPAAPIELSPRSKCARHGTCTSPDDRDAQPAAPIELS
jgi:hypothetical protein